MKRLLSFGFSIALISSAFAACTMDFNQFQPGAGGSGGAGGSCATECCAASDCPPPSDPCMQATCNAGSCGEEARADNTPTGNQTPADCKQEVCVDGAPMTINDDTDVDDDGNDCTTEGCSNGEGTSMPVLVGTACTSNNGKVCDGEGACVECAADSDCPPETAACDTNAHICIPASCTDGDQNGTETDVDCGGGVCAPCPAGDDCVMGSDCLSGVCNNQNKCAQPSCNDGVKNGSETDVDCGGSCNGGCGPGEMCGGDNDCEGNDCTGGVCVPNCNDGVKNNTETDIDCGGGTCGGCDIGQDCANVDANCLSGNCGAGDKCEAGPLGSVCAANGDCMSGNCVDNVCCDTTCTGTCKSCNLPGTMGTCTDIASGQDPADECTGMQVCNGAGVCKRVNGQTCGNNTECLSAQCVDGVCCNTACATGCMACDVTGSVGTCTNVPNGQDPHNDCTGSQVCNGAGMCVKLANGAPCAANADCTSNFCTDGVCCVDDCMGLCKRCDVTGSEGTCSFIPLGQDPDSECNGAMSNCDGAGMCN